MAKLYFRYGAMNSGKSTSLLQAAHNYEERDHRILLAKPGVDTKAGRQILSRLGVVREIDYLLGADDDAYGLFQQHRSEVQLASGRDVSCLLIDEAQFLSTQQVDDLLRIAVLDGIPVICYGIRTDFRTEAFPGSRRLLEIAHSLEELKTICRCGRKAIFTTRRVGGRAIFDGAQVAIDGGAEVTYEAVCAACYLAESGGRLP